MQTQTTTMLILEILLAAGWLRKNEMTLFIEDKSIRTIENAICTLKKSGEIEHFRLPDNFGNGYLLTEKGCGTICDRLGFASEFNAKLMKSTISRIEELQTRKYPMHWMHHLLSSTALAAVSSQLKEKQGNEVIFENKIRKAFRNLKKIPDGIIISEKTYVWLETENIQKVGHDQLKLAKTVVQFEENTLPRFCDLECRKLVIAYPTKNEFCITDLEKKIQEIAVGYFFFIALPLNINSLNGEIIAGAPYAVNINAKGNSIYYNKLNEAIFNQYHTRIDHIPSRSFVIRGYEVEYKFSKEEEIYKWNVSEAHVLPKAPFQYGENHSLEHCKREICSFLDEFFNEDEPEEFNITFI